MHPKIKCFAASVSAFLGGSLLATTLSNWEMVGPGGGGAFRHPAISPDGKELLCASDMGAAFRGKRSDLKMHFINHNAIRLVTDGGFVFNPGKPGEVYVPLVNRGLMHSNDNGKTWEKVSLPVEEPNWNGKWPPPTVGPAQIGFSRKNPAKAVLFYANYAKTGHNVLCTTNDNGKTWTLKKIFPPEVNSPQGISYTAKGEIIFALPNGIRLLDATGAIKKVYDCKGNMKITGFVSSGEYFYAAANRNGAAVVLISKAGSPFKEVKIMDHAEITYIQTTCKTRPVVYFALKSKGDASVYKTANNFKNFRRILYRDSASKHYNISNPQWTNSAWGVKEPLQSLTVCASNSQLAMTTDATQAYITLNGGRSWKSLAAPAGPGGSKTTKAGGMPVMSAYQYYFDPCNYQYRYIAMMDFCNWGSYNGGKTWAQYNKGNQFPHNVYTLLYDEKIPGKIWAGSSHAHDLPHWKEKNNPLINHGGLMVSLNSGRSWSMVDPKGGLPPSTITGLVLDPNSPPNRRTLFASLYGIGIYRSDDDGKTWRDSSVGITPYDRKLFKLRRDAAGRLWTISSTNLPAALYCSEDQGKSWKKVFNDSTFSYLTNVIMHPTRKDTLFLSAFSTVPYHDVDGGIKRSDDAGKTWKTILPGYGCWGVYIHPKTPEIMFATTYNCGLLVSYDAGKNWKEISDFPALSPVSVTFDPRDPDTIYVSCFGASIFKGKINR